jgi:peptidoglycan/xylan/chitin deacetylase (PgdA/CDA1 family)
MLALTFDDGPDPCGTLDVLAALESAGMHATFFVLGERVAAHPWLLDRVLAAGHRVEIHGFAHLRHPAHPRRAVAEDLDAALAELARRGVQPRLWRTPNGDLAPWSAELAAARELRLAGWTVDTNDWRGDRLERMLQVALAGLEAGAIVLAHDGIGPRARRRDCASTAALIAPLVAAARERGIAVGPIDPALTNLPTGNPKLGFG